MIHDSEHRYGTVSRLLHWGMGALLLWQMLKFFDRISEGEHWIGQTLVPWHVSIGSVLLLLVVVRIVWAASQRRHRPVQDPATAGLVKAGHVLLYLGMALMPITGLMTMLGKGYGWKAFGVQLVERGAEIPWLAAVGSLHSPIAWALLAMVVGHVGIALVHGLVKKDGVLQRML